ncbi:MAG: GtrA family protein [Hyphomonas sp.]|nr:GtrA family protein [Hyphomonas sp.]
MNTAEPQSLSLVDKVRQRMQTHQQLVKYVLIGGTASLIDLVLFFVLYNFAHTSELVAHSVSVPTAVIFSFLVNARHNFKTTDHTALRFLSFCIVCTIGYAVGYGVILATQSLLESQALAANVGKILSLPVVFIVQFILNSRITFRKSAA